MSRVDARLGNLSFTGEVTERGHQLRQSYKCLCCGAEVCHEPDDLCVACWPQGQPWRSDDWLTRRVESTKRDERPLERMTC